MKPVNMKKDVIKAILTKIQSELNNLHELLNKEKTLLAESDFENITEIAELKKQIISEIEMNDARFKTILKDSNDSGSENNVHDIIIKHIPDCSNLWIEIESLLKICKDKNSINGIILSNNRRQIQQRLSILQGQSNEILT
ncbi:MAG: flagella synthesis protein FlgN, partial [Gammaproteobacteria bacterium]